MDNSVPAAPAPIAIIGIGCLFPKADNLNQFWSNIKNRVDAITDVPPSHWKPEDYFHADPKAPDHTYAARGGFLSPVNFPPLEYGIAPNALEATDTSQLLGMVVARQALADAGYGPERSFNRDRVSVILGVTGTLELVIPLGARLGHPIWRRALREAGVPDDVANEVVDRIGDAYVGWQENSFPGLLGNVVAGRIANRLDLGGTNCVVDAACASSLSAVHLAMLELQAGRADMVLTGGVDTFNDIFMYMCFSKTPALSPTGNAKPFDIRGDGTILGEGLGMLVLKRLADAERDGDRIYAVVRGLGSSSDGKGNAIYAPKAGGQVKALREAYRQAAVTPDTIGLVEAHGTGTKAGDATEVAALTEVYQSAGGDSRWCAVGSIKSQIGHTKAAAGAAGLIKAALALDRKVLPPTIKVNEPLEQLAAEQSPFYVNTDKRPWVAANGGPRRAAISSFGFGGSNFHCVLEEYRPSKRAIDWDGSAEIVALSADSLTGLRTKLDQLGVHQTGQDWRSAAAESRRAFRGSALYRVLIVMERDSTDRDRLIANARTLLARGETSQALSHPDGIYFGRGPADGQLAVIFPGQGSQYIGMQRDLACQFPQMLAALTEAERTFGGPLSEFIYPKVAFTAADRQRNEERLRATDVAQPAIGAVSFGSWHVLDHFGVRAHAVAGHSFGELTALCAAGRIEPAAFFALAKLRGQLMAEGTGDRGAMLAVRAPLSIVDEVLADARLDLVIANKNAPSQCVLSGASEAIAQATSRFEGRKIPTQRLPVSAAFHSPLVAAVRGRFRDGLKQVAFAAERLPVYANTTAERYPADPDQTRDLLAEQLARPVEFVNEIENLYGAGIRTFVEVGPGNKMSGLIRAILDGKDHEVLALDASVGKRSGITDLARALAQIAALGHAVDLTLWEEGSSLPANEQEKKPTLTVPIGGANYVKPKSAKPSRKTMVRHIALENAKRDVATNGEAAPAPAPEVVAPKAPPAANAPGSPLAQAWRMTQDSLIALQKLSEQTAQLHKQFLEGQDRAQQTFRALLEQEQRLFGLSPEPAAPAREASSRVAEAASPSLAPRPPLPPQFEMQTVEHAEPSVSQIAAAPPRPNLTPAPAASQHVTATLLAVVADKTGYPAEMLNLHMALDADLGIDSIKRVEILSALQEKLPDTPPIKPEHLGSFHTLQDVVSFLSASAPDVPERNGPTVLRGDETHAAVKPGRSDPAPRAQSGIWEQVCRTLLEVVGDKTGYPTDMLNLDMALDADLGIDSIKRVEILSALQEKLTEAPAVKPEHLGTMHTLRHVVSFLTMEGDRGTSEADRASSPLRANARKDAEHAAKELLLQIVAEKTGYPAEMLNLDMALDADLGIDSIKRVEIFSALQERLPEAPTIKPEHLGTMHTLQQVLEFLSASESGILSQPGSPSSAAEHASKPPAEAIERLVLTKVSLPPVEERKPVNLAPGSEIWVTNDETELSAAIVRRLDLLGYESRLVDPRETMSQLRPAQLGGLVIVAPIGNFEDGDLRNALRLLQHAAPALRSHASPFFATVARLDGSFGVEGSAADIGATAGGLAGMAKTAGHEWPEVACKAIDVSAAFSDADEAAVAVVDEALTAGPAEVGIGNAGRCTLQLAPWPLSESAGDAPLKRGDVVVITGGARGVTAEVAVALTKAYAATVVLLGRSPAPSPEPEWLTGLMHEGEIKKALTVQANGQASLKYVGEQYRLLMANREMLRNIQRMRVGGATVHYRSVDVRDAAAVRGILREIRQAYGPIRGLIHGAGVLADRRIEEKTAEQFDLVYGTKVVGLRAALEELPPSELRVLALFSSSTARFGRVGQVDYAMANEVLNKMAQREARRRPHCRVIAVNWGPWDGGMVTPALKKMFESEGVGIIPLEAGADYLIRELSAENKPPAEVVIFGSSKVGVAASTPLFRPETPHVVATSANGHANASARTAMEMVLERKIDVAAIPVLQSHVLNGHAVMPMALTLEWLAHAAAHGNPGLAFHGFNSLQVLKGVVFPEDGPRNIRLYAGRASKRDGVYAVPVELRSASGGNESLHARADILLASKIPDEKARLARPADKPLTLDIAAVYNQYLFHGPDLQGIERIAHCSPAGIAATVAVAPPPAVWSKQPVRNDWFADPMALDCAFQLMIVWSREHRGAASLPCGAGRYRQYRRAFPRESVQVVIQVTQDLGQRVIATMEFLDGQGKLIARLDEYECVLDAALAKAFRRNTLSPEPIAST